MKCPVCKKELIKSYEDFLDGLGPLMESSYHCKDKHYYYDFAYGSYREHILGSDLEWHYTTKDEVMDRIDSRRKELIKGFKGRRLKLG